MSKSRKGRLLRGIFAKGVGQGAQIIIRLVEVPLYLSFWGAALYGEWLILVAVPFYLSLSDFGFAGATNKHMAILVGRGRQDDALAYFRTSFFLVLGLSTLMVLGFWLLVSTLPLDALFGVTHISHADALLIVAVLGMQVVFASQTRLLFGGYFCVGRYPLGFLLISCTDLLRFGFAMAVVVSGGTPISVAWAMLAGQVVGMVAMRLALYRVNPWFRYGLKGSRLEYARELLTPAISAMAFPIGEALSFQGVRLVIASAFGPVAVAAFVAHRQLARLANLAATLSQVFQSELSIAYGEGALSQFRELSRRLVKSLIWLIALLIFPLALISAYCFELWTRGEVQFAPVLFGLLMVASMTEALWRSLLAPTIAINKHAIVGLVYLTVSILLVPAALLTSAQLGLDGIAVAIAAAELVVLIVACREMLRTTDDKLAHWIRYAITPPKISETIAKRMGV